jgi:deoxycytidylate deaminase
MSQIDRGFDAAFAASELSDAPRPGLRMGAALFSGSRLLSVGANLYGRSHPASVQSEDFWRSTHCEHVALLRRQHYDTRSKLTLFVARRRMDGTVGSSRPCVNCFKLCLLAGVTRVWFHNSYGQREAVTP